VKKILLPFILTVIALTTPTGARADDVILAAFMDGADETPPNDSTGLSVAVVTINSTFDTIDYFVTFENLVDNAISGHIHVGQPGVAGPITFGFVGIPSDTSGTFSGQLTAADFQPGGGLETFDDAIVALLTGACYTNIHSTTFPSGEIRGQLYLFDF
jgi:hypothetical protein